MKFARVTLLAMLVATLASTSALACDHPGCGRAPESNPAPILVMGFDMPALSECIVATAGAVKTGVIWTSQAGCTAIETTSEQLSELPENIRSGFDQAGRLSTDASERSANLLQTVGQAISEFTSSLLEILFSSISARALVIWPY